MTKIDPSMFLSSQTKAATPSPDLGKDAFLKILVAQLQNQDPMNPMEDKEFIAQMASFSSLEQMMQMTASIDRLVESQMVSPVIKYSHMIGKTVSYRVEDTGSIKESSVKSVSQKDGWAILELDNGEKVFADAITNVSEKKI